MKVLLTAINAKYIHSNLAVYSLKAYAEKYQIPDCYDSLEELAKADNRHIEGNCHALQFPADS